MTPLSLSLSHTFVTTIYFSGYTKMAQKCQNNNNSDSIKFQTLLLFHTYKYIYIYLFIILLFKYIETRSIDVCEKEGAPA